MRKRDKKSPQHEDRRELGRRRDSAEILGFSEAQIVKFEKQGLIKAIRIPGVRAVRHHLPEVRALAQTIAAGKLTDPAA
jgi:hypothetical protein